MHNHTVDTCTGIKQQQNIITDTVIKKQKRKNNPYIVIFQPTGVQIWFGSLLKINRNEINKTQQWYTKKN